MNDESGVSQTNYRPRVIARLGMLVGASVLGLAMFGPLAFHLHGPRGVQAALLAALVCTAGAAGALLVALAMTQPLHAPLVMLAGMMLRMGLPLGAALLVQTNGGSLAEAGFAYYILAFYFVCLAVEIPLSLPGANRTAEQASKSIKAS